MRPVACPPFTLSSFRDACQRVRPLAGALACRPGIRQWALALDSGFARTARPGMTSWWARRKRASAQPTAPTLREHRLIAVAAERGPDRHQKYFHGAEHRMCDRIDRLLMPGPLGRNE